MPAPAHDPVENLIEECLARIEAEGSAVVDEVCRRHPEHAAAVRAGLVALRGAGLVDQDAEEPAPERLGDFRILQRLGGGNMGVVFLAEQTSLGRKVALKVIRPERLFFAGSRERFRREVESVARLQHPNIAQVFLAGEENGLPYFAMEHVEGATLASALQALAGRQPDELGGEDLARAVGGACSPAAQPAPLFAGSWVATCLRIVQQAAQALAHAHERGVLHRDVKPSNLMLTPAGRVLLVDFGLARTEGSAELTATGSPMGSLAYMSPEQLEGRHKELGPAADIYSLGVTLYELLALRRPHDGSTTVEICRRISAGRPERLRARNRAVSVDAETVCLKAMDADPGRRYASAADFARDLDNVLAFRPIAARRAGWLQRTRRFARRSPAAALAIVLGCLLVLGTPSALYWNERSARAAIELEAEVARRTVEFMVSLFESASPGQTLGEEVPVRYFLAQGVLRIEQELKDQPAVRSRLLVALARVHLHLGSHDQAASLLREAGGSAGPETVETEWLMAKVSHAEGQYEEALALYRRVLDDFAVRHGERSTDYAECLADQGVTLQQMGRMAEAQAALRRAVELLRQVHGDKSGRLAAALDSLAGYLVTAGRPGDARPLFEEALGLRERAFPKGSPATVSNLQRLGRCLTDLGELDAAERRLRRALDEGRRIFPRHHPSLAAVLISYAHFLQRAGRPAEAEAPLREALSIEEAALGKEHSHVAWCLNDLGSLLSASGRAEEARPLLQRALAINRRVHGNEHQSVATALANLADAEITLGNQVQAERLAREALTLQRSLDQPASLRTAGSLMSLAWVLFARGAWDEVGENCREAIAIFEQHPQSVPEHARAHGLLAMVRNLRGDATGGEQQARKGRELLASGCPPVHPVRAHNAYVLGWSLDLQGKDGAEACFLEAIGLYDRIYPAGNRELAFVLDNLGALYVRRNRTAEGLDVLRRAVEMRRKLLPPGDHWLLVSAHNLATAHFLLGDDAAARPLLAEVIESRRQRGDFPNRNLAASLWYAALLEQRAGAPGRAADFAEECLKHQRALHPKGAAVPANTASLLGSLRCELGNLEAAEQLLLGALQDLTAGAGRGHADSKLCAQRLVQLYEKWGKPERAAEFRER
jgi:serine/threonine protein kinase/tetratricopeptide (TPR) repeat protein